MENNDKEMTGVVFGYERISVDTEKEENENTSIENQSKIINDYVKLKFPNCTLREFQDRDRSGYQFEQREQYQQMRKLLMKGESKILIVKDFSRFARRNSLGLLELEQLRDAGIRIISIMDAVDFPTHDEWLVIQFRFMTNELPVTDTSKKVKRVVTNAQKHGEWLCAVPYGYVITNSKKNEYEIVPDEAEVIKEIFRLYAEGNGYKKIADTLSEQNIPTPRMKEKMRIEEKGDVYKRRLSSKWSIITVQSILRNDFYIGTLRQHKYTRTKINGDDIKVDDSEQFIFEKHHKSIIDDKTFLAVREMLKIRQKTNYRGVKKYDNPYTGYLFCGDCKSPMFAMSRAELAPAYTCGTYHRHGKAGCTSHHTRVDFLDKVLLDYVKMIKINSRDMIDELEKTIAEEGENIYDNDKVLSLLNTQLENSREELKATKKQKIRDITKNLSNIELIEDTYFEIEDEIERRILGIEEQIKNAAEKRNDIVEVNRAARTVFDVFDKILNKERLDKVEIGLIIDRIEIFEDGVIEIKLKSDVENLLKAGKLPNEEINANFNFDSIGISFKTMYTQKSHKHADKAYTVNVVSKGDPLEIYTEKDGEVIFKKYSPIGELGDFAVTYAETLNKTAGVPTMITDRDNIIAVSGVSKKEFLEKRVSPDIENLMSEKESFKSRGIEPGISIAEGNEQYNAGVVVPIVSEGDTIGSVIFVMKDRQDPTETEVKLAEAAAGFLGRHMEG